MVALEVREHEHLLKLIDLKLEYPVYYYHYYEKEKEEDDREERVFQGRHYDDEELQQVFQGACDRCHEEINMYHRHYYKCMICDNFSLHKFCGELPRRLENPLHRHPLFQQWLNYDWRCSVCQQKHKRRDMCYGCSECYFPIDFNCAVEVGKNIIHHPCHPHLLFCAISQPILCNCKACGKRHEGIFFQCTICNGFTIHRDCAFLPQTLLIQQRTNDVSSHAHPLTLSYSFPLSNQAYRFFPRCKVCCHDFIDTKNLWIYKCDKCWYYAHVDCATLSSEGDTFMSILIAGRKIITNYKDVDHPHLLQLPFPDETCSLPKHLFFQESRRCSLYGSDEVNLTHLSHQHALILVDVGVDVDVDVDVDPTQSSTNNSWLLLKCHDPMKKIQLLCNGCLRPIMSTMPFYKCVESCDFALHEWCTRLQQKIENHPGHPQHTLHLIYSNVPGCFFGVFDCAVCCLPCNGFAYCCDECEYYVDVGCGLIPHEITHKFHAGHLLSLVQNRFDNKPCHMCLLASEEYCLLMTSFRKKQLVFTCNVCDVYIHPDCALLLSERIRHKYDKHTMQLRCGPIEDQSSEYFCEVCEEALDPNACFYNCQVCVRSIHTACAPLILQCEMHTACAPSILMRDTEYQRATHYFMNIKFGGIHNTRGHPHPLAFAQGIALDGQCSMCGKGLQYKMIFKCLECKFVIDYKCCLCYYKE